MKRYVLNTETTYTGEPAKPIRDPLPHEVSEADPIPPPEVVHWAQTPTEAEIEELMELWSRLLPEFDFQSDKWYATDETGDWIEVSFPNVQDFLYDLGVGEEPKFEEMHDEHGDVTGWRLIPDPERMEVIRQFRLRDSQRKSGGRATRRLTADMKKAQERFGQVRRKPAPRGFWPLDPIE